MYDYSENEEERRRFILNYDIEDGKIILHFATGNDKVIPYGPINELRVLKQMNEELQDIPRLKEKINDDLEDLKIYKIGSLGKFIISLIGILAAIRIFYSMNVVIYLLGLFGSASMIFGIDIVVKDYDIEKLKKKIKELEKFEYFFKEKEFINTNIKTNQENLSLKANKSLTINDADKLSLEDLKRIRDEILFEKEYIHSSDKKLYLKKR